MRCSCKVCKTYMVHAPDIKMGCICPECKNRCNACLGTNTVKSKEELKNMIPENFDMFKVMKEEKDFEEEFYSEQDNFFKDK